MAQFKKGRRKTGGRKKGTPNRWKKADLDAMREHVQAVLDRRQGGVESLLDHWMRRKPQLFAGLLRDLTPKPAAKVEAEATVTLTWEAPEPKPEGVDAE